MNGPYLTRKQLIEAVRAETGIPVAQSTVDKASMNGTGPQPVARFGRSYLYTKEAGLEWARSLVKPANTKAAEGNQAAA